MEKQEEPVLPLLEDEANRGSCCSFLLRGYGYKEPYAWSCLTVAVPVVLVIRPTTDSLFHAISKQKDRLADLMF